MNCFLKIAGATHTPPVATHPGQLISRTTFNSRHISVLKHSFEDSGDKAIARIGLIDPGSLDFFRLQNKMAQSTLQFKSCILFTSMLVSSVHSISMLYEQPIGCDIMPGRESGPPLIRSSSKMWLEGYKAGCTQFLQNYIPDHRDGKSLVIGIAGGSGSGKTTIKDVIVEQLSGVRVPPAAHRRCRRNCILISWGREGNRSGDF
jgi:hypothetical protein